MSAATETKSETTARPWSLERRPNCTVMVGPDGQQISFAEDNDNSALVVRAVNSHDALVEALEKIESALRADRRQKTISGDTVEYHLDGQAMWHAINAARAALARARGEAVS